MAFNRNLLSNLWWGGVFSFCLWGVASKAIGETAPTSQTLSGQTKTGIQATGYIDLRPSWITKTGNFTTEDTVELGAKLTQDTSVTYMQGLLTNLYDPMSGDANGGLKPKLDAGALKVNVKNLWKDDSQGLSLGYENRTYLPVDEASQNRGMIASIRNYLKLSKKVNDRLQFTLSEIAIPIVNNRSGVVSKTGEAVANKIFENRVYLVTDIQLTEKLALSLPVMFHQSRTANFRSDASQNASWSFHVWTSPELDYAMSENLTLGVAYYNNDSFFTPNLSKSQFGQALESGEFQFVLTASL